MSLNFPQQLTTDLAALECLKNQCLHFFAFAFQLIVLNLHPRRKCISWMSSNFGQIEPQAAELAALERV